MASFNNIFTHYKETNILEKIIYANVAVFLLVFIFNTFGFLFEAPKNIMVEWFALPASFDAFVYKPWTIITYGFLHVGFIHILLNLISLFFIGNLFIEYFTNKQLLTFYLLGTLCGGIIFLLSYNYFPVLVKEVDRSVLLGASAGVSAIFIGIAAYLPNYQFKIPLIGFVKLWYLAVFWVVLDIIQIPFGNAGGHFAHLGGALFGFLYVRKASNIKIDIFNPFKAFFTPKEKPLKTVYKSKSTRKKKTTNKNEHQQQIDAILDKISKSGYETLTKEEKAFLFKQGTK